jgi:hypothetical protein
MIHHRQGFGAYDLSERVLPELSTAPEAEAEALACSHRFMGLIRERPWANTALIPAAQDRRRGGAARRLLVRRRRAGRR